MVHRGADEWRSQRQCHATVEMVQFERDQTLIVIHAHHRVVIAARRMMKQTIRGKRSMHGNPALACRLDRWRDDVNLLGAEVAFFTAVGIERRHRDARPGDAEGFF